MAPTNSMRAQRTMDGKLALVKCYDEINDTP